MRRGIKSRINDEQRKFLMQNFSPDKVDLHYGDESNVITYRDYAMYYNCSFYNTNGREAIERADNPDFLLGDRVRTSMKHQAADQMRSLIYDGEPLELLIQCVMLEITFKLNLLPRRTDTSSNQVLLDLAQELHENDTFNV